MPAAPTLQLVAEYKFARLFGPEAGDRLEASGVCAWEGAFYVIFDHWPHVARIENRLPLDSADRRWFRQRGESAGYEDITFDEGRRRFCLLIESAEFAPGVFKARVEEYDEDFRYVEGNWLDFELPSANKGLEGLTYAGRGGGDFLLAMCEGNKCKGGAPGRKPGGGRIHVFEKSPAQWDHIARIKLPKSVLFEDYSGLDLLEDRVVVVSQASSALWTGRLHAHDWSFVDDGVVYDFPRSEKGKSVYGNVEGVSWISKTQVVVVSDKIKAGNQPKRCEAKDQSIHIFDLGPP